MLGSAPTDVSDKRFASGTLGARALQSLRIPYGLRRIPAGSFARVLPLSAAAVSGDVALARVDKIGKNTRLELANGRACTLHVGDLLAVVFGNRYATMQFEGYAKRRGTSCELLSMGGLCGMVESKHDSVPDATQLSLLGLLADGDGAPLRLECFTVAAEPRSAAWPRVVVVCGTSMDAGKTYTAASLIEGLARQDVGVAGIKLTGTAAGRDTWGMLDAGALVALDFIDGGFPSTYLTPVGDLLHLHEVLVSYAASLGATWVIMEIADGLLERETSALLQTPEFRRSVDGWIFAAGDALAAGAGVSLLKQWGIQPSAVSGRVTMSPLSLREAEIATGLPCLTARELQGGELARTWLGEARTSRPISAILPLSPVKSAIAPTPLASGDDP
jgi:hypothetical protein